MTNKTKKPKNELKVFISGRDSRCDECGEQLGHGAWIILQGEKGAVCLECADLDHLAFLPSGDAALTRRSRKHSKLSAIVLKWSKTRNRYERQGLLVENGAIDRAEQECEADALQRQKRRAHAAIRRAELDKEYIKRFASRVRKLYPFRPKARETIIAEHACRKYSGRVGRSAAAKELDEQAVRLAVGAHIRHVETEYDELLMRGLDRTEARHTVRKTVSNLLETWKFGSS
ncbi:MAG: DUF2293 domain-containing protein [Desulfobacterales bacterium]|nr:DUF2293 domain-containing protein [Desulfobacterales bacterium]